MASGRKVPLVTPKSTVEATEASEAERYRKMTWTQKYMSAVIPEGGDGEFCKTYVIKNQGHTLGNALKFIISHYGDVSFCGYTQPHPAEDVIHFRIQSVGTPVDTVIRRGLEDMRSICDQIEKGFIKELDNFNSNAMQT